MDGMCEEQTSQREMRKIRSAIFFLTPGICMRFHAKICENIAKSRQKMIPACSLFSVSFPREILKENLLFSVNTKNISSNVLKISENSLVLRTREFTDIFITLDEIYLVFTSKK